MAQIHWAGGRLWQRFRSWLSEEWFIFKLSFWSLTYNSLTSWNVCIDTALEPLFWFVDHFIRYLGPVFVVVVVCLVFSVIIIFYVCLLPEKYAESYFWTVYHLVFGHWMLYNTVYHYFKAAFIDPGHPPEKIPEVVSICKKCIAPKPPRAHHCSVCDKCVLKMDHHCPWLNNCVGHNNHRHFFLFCAYMWAGTIYVSISAYPAFKEHFIGSPDVTMSGYFYPLHIISEKFWKYRMKSTGVLQHYPNGTVEVYPTRDYGGIHFHHFILYEFLLCSAVALALGLLTLWHARMISRGETSIEIHINKKEKRRMRKKGLVFKNPYSFGVKRNWEIFLGLTDGRTFWKHVLFPSNHKPESDGLTWELSTKEDNGLLLL